MALPTLYESLALVDRGMVLRVFDDFIDTLHLSYSIYTDLSASTIILHASKSIVTILPSTIMSC